MSLASNATSVVNASTFGVDKIVRIFTGSFDVATDPTVTLRTGSISNLTIKEITHGLTRPVFCESQWSLDGITWIDGGSQDASNQTSLAYSDGQKVYVISPVVVGVVYYRVWCSWIGSYDASNPLVEMVSYTDVPIQYDSRLNYQKIKHQDVLTYTAGSGGSTETQSITHSLGYTPNAKVWFESISGEVWPLNAGGISNPFLFDASQEECRLEIKDNQIDVMMDKYSSISKRAWYKIYYDANQA